MPVRRGEQASAATRGQQSDDPLRTAFTLAARIGEGSQGPVYRGYTKGTFVSRALKFVNADAMERELSVWRSVQHRHVVPLLAHFEPHLPSDRSQCVLVFPEREGDLAHFLARRRGDMLTIRGLSGIAGPSIPQHVIATWAHQLADALAYLHHIGIVHRDVKPGNILLKWNEAGFSDIELADLGCARMMPVPERRRFKTKTEVDLHGAALSRQEGLTPHVCTLAYAAPEMWCCGWDEHESSYGYAADMWSYGTVIFETLTLEIFSAGKTDAARMATVIARLGACPHDVRLGPRQGLLITAARTQEAASARSLHDFGAATPGTAWGHLAQVLRWAPDARSTARAMLSDLWVCNIPATTMPPAIPAVLPGAPPPSLSASPREPHLAAAEHLGVELSSGTPFSNADIDRQSLPMAKRRKGVRCSCAGHCYTPGHRYHGGCDCPDLVEDSRYCMLCVCSMFTCRRPRYHSVFCHGDLKIFQALPPSFALAHAAQASLGDLFPSDIVAFVSSYGQLQSSLVAVMCIAFLKEPTAVKAFTATWPGHRDIAGPPAVLATLSQVVKRVHETPHTVELEQLQRQGVGRFMGVLPFCRSLGVVRTAPAEAEGEVYTLGLTQRRVLLETACSESLAKFVTACTGQEQNFERQVKINSGDLQAVAGALSAIVHRIDEESGMRAKGYVLKNVIRKMVVCAIQYHGAASRSSWSDILVKELRHITPDCHKALAKFPASFSVADASDMVCGRRDHGVFLSMWACLFGEVAKLWPDRLNDMKRLLSSEQCVQILAAFKARHGVAPCPVTLMRELLARE